MEKHQELGREGKALGREGKALGREGKALGREGKALGREGKALRCISANGTRQGEKKGKENIKIT